MAELADATDLRDLYLSLLREILKVNAFKIREFTFLLKLKEGKILSQIRYLLGAETQRKLF